MHKNLRPYEPLTGMTTTRWHAIEAKYIDIDILQPSQEHLCDEWVPGMRWTGDLAIYVVYYEGVYWISDGHNRWNRKKEEGAKMILARVLYKVNDTLLMPFKEVA